MATLTPAQIKASLGNTQELNVGTSATSQGRIFMSQPSPVTTKIAQPLNAQNAISQADKAGAFNIGSQPSPSLNASSTGTASSSYSTPAGTNTPSTTSTPASQAQSVPASPTVPVAPALPKMNYLAAEQAQVDAMTDPLLKKTAQDNLMAKSKQLTADLASGTMTEAQIQAKYGFVPNSQTTAEGNVNAQYKADGAAMEAAFGPSDLASNLQKKGAQALLDAQEKMRLDQLAAQKQQNDAADQAAAYQRKVMGEQGSAAISANNAQFSQGAEGVQSTGKTMLGKEFATSMSQKIEQANNQLSAAQVARDNAYQQLMDAQNLGRLSDVKALSQQYASAQQNVQNAQAAYAKSQSDASAQALDIITKVAAASKAYGVPMFTGMSTDQIAQALHIPQQMATMVQAMDASAGKINKNDPDYLYKVAQTNKINWDMAHQSMDGTAKAIDNITTLRYLGMNDAADEIAKQYNLSGTITHQQISDQISSDLSNQASTHATTGAYVPVGGVYKVTQDGSGGIIIDTTKGECPPNGRGQCGEFVNDFYSKSTHLFGDSYLDKMQKSNSDVPVVGGAFIVKVAGSDNGHVGIVTKVFSDGSFAYTDSNWHEYTKPLTVDTGIKGSDYLSQGITGFFDPSKPVVVNGKQVWTPNPKIAEANSATNPIQPIQQDQGAATPPLPSKVMEDAAQLYANGGSFADLKAIADTQSNGAPAGSKYEKAENAKALEQMVSRATQIKMQRQNPKSFNDLSDADKNLVNSLADYSADLTKFTNARTLDGRKDAAFILEQVKLKNPSFDMKEFPAQQKFLTEWRGGGYKQAKDALVTATGHLTDLADKADPTFIDYAVPKIIQNPFKSALESTIGNPLKTSWDTNANAVSGELAKVFKGTGSSNEGEVEAWRKTLDYNGSAFEKKNAVKEGVGLMISRMEAMKNSYESNMGKPIDQPLMSPEAYSELSRLHDRGFIDEDKWESVKKLQTFGETSGMTDAEIYQKASQSTQANQKQDNITWEQIFGTK